MTTASTATPLRSPSAEPVVMRALAGIPLFAIALLASLFEEVPLDASLFDASLAPAGVMQPSSAAMAKGAPIIEAEREKCDIASSTSRKFCTCVNLTRIDKTPETKISYNDMFPPKAAGGNDKNPAFSAKSPARRRSRQGPLRVNSRHRELLAELPQRVLVV